MLKLSDLNVLIEKHKKTGLLVAKAKKLGMLAAVPFAKQAAEDAHNQQGELLELLKGIAK